MNKKYFTSLKSYPPDKPVTKIRKKNYKLVDIPACDAASMKCEYCLEITGVIFEDAWACAWIDCPTWHQEEIKPPKPVKPPYVAQIPKCRQPKALIKAMELFAKDPVGFVVFTGVAGMGKSYFAKAIANDAEELNSKTAYFINVSELYREWLKAKKEMMEEDLILRHTECKLLILDDLGKRTPTEAFFDFLYLILNIRLERKMGTIVTTNCRAAEIAERFGNEIVSRIYSGKVFEFNIETDKDLYLKDRRTEHHKR